MSEVIVDEEKLANGIERGISHIPGILRSERRRTRLRHSICGLASSAIHEYAKNLDLPSQLLISNPKLSIDPEMQHVVTAIMEPKEDPKVIDATYSQFLEYSGLSIAYERKMGIPVFPKERVIVFQASEIDLVTNWLAEVSMMFHANSRPFEDRYGFIHGEGPLSGSSAGEIKSVLNEIYDPANMTPWVPRDDYICQQGKIVSTYIAKDAILIS